MRYYIKLRDKIYVKGYEFLSFLKNIGKNISKSLRGKYSQTLLDHDKKSATNTLNTVLKMPIKKLHRGLVI